MMLRRAVALLFLASAPAAWSASFDHSAFDSLLHKHVANGLVDYDDLDDTVRGRLRELLATSVASMQTFIFAVDPPISNPAGEWIATDTSVGRTVG